jgi:hypothetical protein
MYLFVLYYVFLCRSMYCLFCDVPCTVCVYMCTVLLPLGGYPITIKYIIYHNIKWIGIFQSSMSARQTTEGHNSVDLHVQVAFEWRKIEPWTARTQYHCAHLPLSWHWCIFFLPPADRLLQPTCSHITELDKCKKCLQQRCQIIPDKLFDTFVCSCNISYGCSVVSGTPLVRQCNIPLHLRVSRNDTSEHILILRLCPWTETSLFKEINSRQTPNKENYFVPRSQHSEVKRC